MLWPGRRMVDVLQSRLWWHSGKNTTWYFGRSQDSWMSKGVMSVEAETTLWKDGWVCPTCDLPTFRDRLHCPFCGGSTVHVGPDYWPWELIPVRAGGGCTRSSTKKYPEDYIGLRMAAERAAAVAMGSAEPPPALFPATSSP